MLEIINFENVFSAKRKKLDSSTSYFQLELIYFHAFTVLFHMTLKPASSNSNSGRAVKKLRTRYFKVILAKSKAYFEAPVFTTNYISLNNV